MREKISTDPFCDHPRPQGDSRGSAIVELTTGLDPMKIQRSEGELQGECGGFGGDPLSPVIIVNLIAEIGPTQGSIEHVQVEGTQARAGDAIKDAENKVQLQAPSFLPVP